MNITYIVSYRDSNNEVQAHTCTTRDHALGLLGFYKAHCSDTHFNPTAFEKVLDGDTTTCTKLEVQ